MYNKIFFIYNKKNKIDKNKKKQYLKHLIKY